MNLLCVPPSAVAQAWPFAHSYIEAATKRNELLSVQEIKSDLLSNAALLWLASDGKKVIGAGVTKLVDGACEIVAWGCDDQKQCSSLLNVIEDFARMENCKAVRFIGPPAWGRVLPAYRKKAVIFERTL